MGGWLADSSGPTLDPDDIGTYGRFPRLDPGAVKARDLTRRAHALDQVDAAVVITGLDGVILDWTDGATRCSAGRLKRPSARPGTIWSDRRHPTRIRGASSCAVGTTPASRTGAT